MHTCLGVCAPRLQARQEHYYFYADCWLDAKLTTTSITLEPSNGEAAGAFPAPL